MTKQEFHIGDDGTFPGNLLPALLFKNALDVPLLFPATYVRQVFGDNNWSNSWDAGIFTYHHYHSVTYEVLGIYSGNATIQLGGDNGPSVLLEKGDVLVIPPGVAHKNLDGENDVGVIGAYPDGKHYDMNFGKTGERPGTDQQIARVPVPAANPIGGPPLYK
jgi:uncharacterized protein YjlB